MFLLLGRALSFRQVVGAPQLHVGQVPAPVFLDDVVRLSGGGCSRSVLDVLGLWVVSVEVC